MFNYDETYDKVFDKILGPNMMFPDFIDLEGVEKRTEKIVDYLLDRWQRMDRECCYCDKIARKEFVNKVYETPWDESPAEKYFCSEECEQNYLYGGDYAYFTCDICGREICGQNPRNGWMVQCRCEDGGMICLQCYETDILKNGILEEKFEKFQIPGMFLDNHDLRACGFEEVTGFTDYFVRTSEQAKTFCEYAIELIQRGCKVAVNYERMAIGGLEGTVTMWAKVDENEQVLG
jgi:hypothetical protein